MLKNEKSKYEYDYDYTNPGKDNKNIKGGNQDYIDYYSDVRKSNNQEDNSKIVKKKNNNTKKNSLNDEKVLDYVYLNSNDENKLTESLKNILSDKEFSSPITIQKGNKLISDFHYATFQNLYGENSCFINVILHLIYNIPQLNDFLISLYEINESNKSQKRRSIKSNDNNAVDKFLVLLGEILYKYDEVLNEENQSIKKEQITVLKTLSMRKMLETISEYRFPLNNIADPVELLTFILDILNEKSNEELHKAIYIELIDEFSCKSRKNCQITIENKYDKDNFIYHIYIDEIIKYIDHEKIKVRNFINKLFELSYQLFLSENIRKCEKCNEEMSHDLKCMNEPEFLLINCVWKESNPVVDDVISLLFLMSLKDDLSNLFVCTNRRSFRKPYCLFGFILYSFTLSHYIICIYNYEKKCFVLFDDEFVKEYNNLLDLIFEITVNTLKGNGKAFFYPVMLIFTRECIYNRDTIKFNTLSESDYTNIIKNCNEAISEYQYQNEIKEEEKKLNYEDMIRKQREIENMIKNKNKKKYFNVELDDKENNKNKKQLFKVEKYENDEEMINKEKNENDIDYEDKNKNLNKRIYKNINIDTSKINSNNTEQGQIGKIIREIKNIKGDNKIDYIGNYRDIDYLDNFYEENNNNFKIIKRKTDLYTCYKDIKDNIDQINHHHHEDEPSNKEKVISNIYKSYREGPYASENKDNINMKKNLSSYRMSYNNQRKYENNGNVSERKYKHRNIDVSDVKNNGTSKKIIKYLYQNNDNINDKNKSNKTNANEEENDYKKYRGDDGYLYDKKTNNKDNLTPMKEKYKNNFFKKNNENKNPIFYTEKKDNQNNTYFIGKKIISPNSKIRKEDDSNNNINSNIGNKEENSKINENNFIGKRNSIRNQYKNLRRSRPENGF